MCIPLLRKVSGARGIALCDATDEMGGTPPGSAQHTTAAGARQACNQSADACRPRPKVTVRSRIGHSSEVQLLCELCQNAAESKPRRATSQEVVTWRGTHLDGITSIGDPNPPPALRCSPVLVVSRGSAEVVAAPQKCPPGNDPATILLSLLNATILWSVTAVSVGDPAATSAFAARSHLVNFASDNVSNAAPEILAAIASANVGTAVPYGEDVWTERLQTRMQALFEHTATVVPVATGTAANGLILATMVPAWGAIYCHADAHINIDECGSPEFYSGGAKIVPLPGTHGKISPTVLVDALRRAGAGDVHRVQPAALSISQPTELGTVYSPQEIRALADLAHAHGLRVHSRRRQVRQCCGAPRLRARCHHLARWG